MMRVLTGARLVVQTIPSPALSEQSVRIKVAYSGVNRADLLQKAGRYSGFLSDTVQYGQQT